MSTTPTERIVRIEKAILRGTRPRHIGHNARIPAHGSRLVDPVVRIYSETGAVGIGWSNINIDTARALLGQRIDEIFTLPHGCSKSGRGLDLPLWDMVARLMNLPLYKLLGARGSREIELYDGSIYIDDLDATDAEAIDLFSAEVDSGRTHGYHNFKVKVGRGARWMPMMEGLDRDALVVRAVKRAAGKGAKILIDANMGNTLNTACHLLDAVADEKLYWFEEPFAEDPALNRALKEFLLDREYAVLVADGEFAPPPNFFEMVEQGFIDVVQHDFRSHGLTWWREIAARLEPWEVLCAPHCWGSYIERYTHAHFAASIPNYCLLESAPVHMPGLIEDGWIMLDGKLRVPDTPGIGFNIEEKVFTLGIEHPQGFHLTL